MNDRENTPVIDQLVPNAVDGDVIPAVQLELSLDEPQLTYRPKFPLPDEINQLPRDQTVCQYCGVSYLVLSEIKQLEERIEKQSSELIDLLAQTQIKDEQIAVVELENKNLNKQLQEIQRNDSSLYQIRNDRDNLRCQVDDLSAAVETAGATEKRCMHELTETRGRLDLAGVQADALRHALIRIRSKCVRILRDSNVMNEITRIRSYLDKIRVHLELKDDAVTMHKAGLECRLRDAEEECATLEHEKQCMEEHCARNESRMVEKRRQWSEEQGTLKGDIKILQLKLDEEIKKVEELRSENLKLVRLHSKELDEMRQRWVTASQMNESLTEKQKRLAEDIAHEKSLTQRLRSESHDTDSNHAVTVQKLQVENYKLSKNMTAIQEELQAAHEEREKIKFDVQHERDRWLQAHKEEVHQLERYWEDKYRVLEKMHQKTAKKLSQFRDIDQEVEETRKIQSAERKLLRRKIEEQNEEITRLQQEIEYITDQTRGFQISSEEAIKQLEQKLQKSNRENIVLREEQQRVLSTMKVELQSCEERLCEANAAKKQLHEKAHQHASHIEELKLTVQRECEERNELQATLLRAREQLVQITDSALDLHERDRQTGMRKSHSVRTPLASKIHLPRLPPLSGEVKSHSVDHSEGSTSHVSSSECSRPNTLTKRKSKISDLAQAKRRIALILSKRLE